jgi:hypothetical protein
VPGTARLVVGFGLDVFSGGSSTTASVLSISAVLMNATLMSDWKEYALTSVFFHLLSLFRPSNSKHLIASHDLRIRPIF